MKTLKVNLSLLLFFAMSLVFVSCGSESSTGDAATDAITTTANDVADATKATAQNAADKVAAAIPTGPTTTVEFADLEFDYGTIKAGEKVSHTYAFTNTGKEPLIISNAKGSCGCTVPKWPKDPIAPGEKGEIQVEFNSKNKKGKQSKRVTITANTDPGQTFLTIKGEVTPDPEEEAKKAAAAAEKAAAEGK